MKCKLRNASVIVWLLTFVVAASGAEPLPVLSDNNSHQRTLTIDPADAPTPAMKYYLRPTSTECVHGNAASFYYRAMLMYSMLNVKVKKQYVEADWSKVAVEDMPVKKVKEWLAHFDTINLELRRAAYRDRCEWDLQIEQLQGLETIEIRLPEMQESRALARMLRLKARVEIAERRYDDAIETMRIGFQLGHDVARPKTLINALVGMAICRIMQHTLDDLIDAPGSPNMYWALTALPRPLIDIRESLEQEMSLPERMFPVLHNAETSRRSVEEWRRLMVDAVGKLRMISDQQWQNLGDRQEKSDEWITAAMMVAAYPQSKAKLLARGYSKEQVDAMPTGQVIAIQSLHDYLYTYQQTIKWSYLPYWQAHDHIHSAASKLQNDGYLGPLGNTRVVLPFASILMPATNAAHVAEVRTEQGTSLLQTVEAIRIYTAQHDRQLPKSLDDLVDFPALRNPYDNEPFHYELKGDTAVLWGYTSQGVVLGNSDELRASFIIHYNITVNK